MTFQGVAGVLSWLGLAYLMSIAIILLARPVVARLAGTNWAYALWGVLLVPPFAMLAPSTMNDSVRIWNYPALGASATDIMLVALLGLWVIGVLATGSVSTWQSVQVRRSVRSSFNALSVRQMSQIEQSCTRANVFPAPKTIFSSYCGSPAVMNGLVPTLVLPDDFFQKYSPRERNLILHHELIHLRRFDLVWNVMFRSLRCLLWFVPFISHCERVFRSDQERSCDHSVICDEPDNSLADYAQALYKTVIQTSSAAGVVGFRNTRHELIIRTELLGTHRRTRSRSMAGLIALTTCVLLSISVSANSNVFPDSAVLSSSWCSIYGRLGL
tara:strand:+ start:3111 stop:4094 length:984 start_codon:yes stop_codon:yes gene_type:complete